MGSELLLGVRLNPQSLTTIKLTDVNLKNKVEYLRSEAAGKVNLPKELFELIYCGSILEDDMPLESYGLKSGVMVHVLKKTEPEIPTPVKPISEDVILQLAAAFKSFNDHPALHTALHRLSKRPEVIDNIISSSPGLHEDSVAIAMLQDPDLMAHFTDVDTVRRIAELHPLLIEAAQNFAAAIHEEAQNSTMSGSNAPATNSQPTAYSYSLDNLSDDEEMAGDSSQSSDSAQPVHPYSTPLNTMLSTGQLATNLFRPITARSLPLVNTPSSTSGGSSNSGVITSEMFSQAMQQAFATVPTPATSAPLAPIMPPVLPQIPDLQRQLAQMHEIGLEDDAVNVQALQFTNGDVQAAIDLVFSGFSDN